MPEMKSKVCRLLIWFTLNLIIFVACYLNYRLQLKHHYLYKTLNAGLCFSRAAAMVINFNLLLVWLPMCKYSLTRLAYLGNSLLNNYNQRRQHLLAVSAGLYENFPVIHDYPSNHTQKFNVAKKIQQLLGKLQESFSDAWFRFKIRLIEIKMGSIKSFLIAVDHCNSLHTICATTITIASVIHTVAHLMNVINFSKNYDPLLTNLNMASFKGQSPIQLLISVPGITGSLMILILILMSLSSVDLIRNSSYDLFRIFHRLSVIFVLLLFLHPSSHVLKEQSNVDRHNPNICYNELTKTISIIGSTSINSSLANNSKSSLNYTKILTALSPRDEMREPAYSHDREQFSELANNHVNDFKRMKQIRSGHRENFTSTLRSGLNNDNRVIDLNINVTIINKSLIKKHSKQQRNITSHDLNEENLNHHYYVQNGRLHSKLCHDLKPTFVAQSSICLYVLCVGLSCYLLDLVLRKLRRSKTSIELINAILDKEGNLIELILSSNHKRFSRWLPGQFVYLNCPQISSFEWHPFTISSMDSSSRQFTLHIKTGGDWTRKLRLTLEQIKSGKNNNNSYTNENSMSPIHDSELYLNTNKLSFENLPKSCEQNQLSCLNNSILFQSQESKMSNLASFECYHEKTGELQIECIKFNKFLDYNNSRIQLGKGANGNDGNDYKNKNRVKIELAIAAGHSKENREYTLEPSQTMANSDGPKQNQQLALTSLNLFIDGPFHSPFERLLEQEISICIANGVGWTAFSSVFQCILNNLNNSSRDAGSWWVKWRDFAIKSSEDAPEVGTINATGSTLKRLPKTKVHLLVIVTSMEQLKPFYRLAVNYFNKIQQHNSSAREDGDQFNPIQEITAYLTRVTHEDESMKEFCKQEKLSICEEARMIQINQRFSIFFDKPNLDIYINSFNSMYSNCPKLSVYCCGSFHVKKNVQEICRNLNRSAKRNPSHKRPIFSYHEENF